jgi:anti-sigma regulatory factor (Ser/Thr protein kinase)
VSTHAATGNTGFIHEAALYDSDVALLEIVVPFLEEALRVGDPAVVALDERGNDLVRAALHEPSAVLVVDGFAQHRRPANTVRAYRELFSEQVAAGARQIRVVGNVPHPGARAPWDWWARYEAAINRLYGEFPVWGICPYDTRSTPERVLDEVVRTHPFLARAGLHVSNPRFEDPETFLAHPRRPSPDPLEQTPPTVELVDPSPATARQAAQDTARVANLDRVDVDDLVLVVNEAVTNGICHGTSPISARLWAGPDRILVTVTDRGQGPSDPFVGLLPSSKSKSAGLGLWMAHQLCDHVTFETGPHGYTLRLVLGEPHLDL